jgi:hypothetical protein
MFLFAFVDGVEPTNNAAERVMPSLLTLPNNVHAA